MGQNLFGALFCGSLPESVVTTVVATFFDPFPDGFGIDIHLHTSTRCDIDIDRVTMARGAIHARTVAIDVHPHATPSRVDRNPREMGAAGFVSVFEIRLDDGRIDLDASASVTAEQERGKGAGRDDRKRAFHGMSFVKKKAGVIENPGACDHAGLLVCRGLRVTDSSSFGLPTPFTAAMLTFGSRKAR